MTGRVPFASPRVPANPPHSTNYALTVNVIDRNSVEQLSFALDAAAVLSYQRDSKTSPVE